MNVIKTRGEFEIHPRLNELAEDWPVYEDWLPILRCRDCDNIIYAGQSVAGHLVAFHGYRMNGKRYNDANEEVPDVSPRLLEHDDSDI